MSTNSHDLSPLVATRANGSQRDPSSEAARCGNERALHYAFDRDEDYLQKSDYQLALAFALRNRSVPIHAVGRPVGALTVRRRQALWARSPFTSKDLRGGPPLLSASGSKGRRNPTDQRRARRGRGRRGRGGILGMGFGSGCCCLGLGFLDKDDVFDSIVADWVVGTFSVVLQFEEMR